MSAITKAETVALWHAVDDMGYMTRAMFGEPSVTSEQIAQREALLKVAKRALRKGSMAPWSDETQPRSSPPKRHPHPNKIHCGYMFGFSSNVGLLIARTGPAGWAITLGETKCECECKGRGERG